mgnify:CR=1 FL=1
MKKFSLLILGILIGAFATYFLCPSCSVDDTEVAIVKPNGVISIAEAIALDKNWTDTRKKAVDSVAGKADNRSAWYSFDDMYNYLSYAKQECKDLGYDMDGVRIYLGVYGDNAPKGKAGYTTMFIVPTGTVSLSKGSSLPSLLPPDSGDVPNGPPLDKGSAGDPPPANYPQ